MSVVSGGTCFQRVLQSEGDIEYHCFGTYQQQSKHPSQDNTEIQTSANEIVLFICWTWSAKVLLHIRSEQTMHSPSPPTFSPMTHGYLRHHRREDAIVTIRIMKSRLASEHISHSLSLLDVSNAFGSLSYEQMDARLVRIVRAEDEEIAQTRYNQVYLFVDCPVQTISFSPGCGGLQGDTFMVLMWLASLFYLL